MRLLHTETYELTDFIDSDVPPYAILSHRWDKEEVLLKDVENAHFQHRQGFQKIRYACTQARQDGWAYLWVDTCGIDKSSSAEMSEAINSMFHWYKNAQICYAYLSDVPPEVDIDSPELAASIWFTRGWTLQELIAPPEVQFYGAYWTYIASRNASALQLSKLLSIDAKILGEAMCVKKWKGKLETNMQRIARVFRSSVASRMSWASCRRTTRVEDMAYCLLGLFEVNMPLLYGEKEKAFLRLQKEIIYATSDLSILAWNPKETSGSLPPIPSPFPLLAPRPDYFKGCDAIVRSRDEQHARGLSITLRVEGSDLHIANARLVQSPEQVKALTCYLSLECRFRDDFTGILGLPLCSATATFESTNIQLQFARVKRGFYPGRLPTIDVLHLTKLTSWPSIIFIAEDPFSSWDTDDNKPHSLWFRLAELPKSEKHTIFRVYPEHHPGFVWNNASTTLRLTRPFEKGTTVCAALDLAEHGRFSILVQNCFYDRYDPDIKRGFGVAKYASGNFPPSFGQMKHHVHLQGDVGWWWANAPNVPSITIPTATGSVLVITRSVAHRDDNRCAIFDISVREKTRDTAVRRQ